MGWLDSFLDPGEGYAKGQEQLDKYYGQSKDLFNQAQASLQPYNQFGQNAYGNLSGAMQRLLDPASLEADWIKGYSASPSAINAEQLATQHGLDAASGLGLMGSNTALNAIQTGTSQIGLNDRQNYLDNLMQKYLAGTTIAGNIFNTGANAANAMSSNAMNFGRNAMDMGENSAQMAYGQQNAGGQMLAGLLGAGIGAAGSALGGPMGGALATRWNLAGSPSSAATTAASGGVF